MSAAPARLEVLLVDDDPVIRKSYGNHLRAEGWNVTIAADGYEALQAGEESRFDLMLLDLRMPFRNGAEVLKSLRARPGFADTVVFLLAQPGDADLVDRAMREGADGVFEKARITPRDVVNEIQGFFAAGGRNAGDPSAQAHDAPPPETNVPAAVDDIARRFRKSPTGRGDDDLRATRASGYVRDPEAAARAVAQRVAQRELDDRDRGPPISGRFTAPLDDESMELPQIAPAAPSVPPPHAPRSTLAASQHAMASHAAPPMVAREETPPPPAPALRGDAPSFLTVLNRFMGESGKLATALGLPPDFLCPVCRQQLALRLWPDPSMEAAVRGHFVCPRCTA